MIEPAPGDHVYVNRGHWQGASGIVQDVLNTTPRPFVTVRFFDSRGVLSVSRDLVPSAYCVVTLMGKKTSAIANHDAEAGTPVSVHCHGSGGLVSVSRARVGNAQSPIDRGATKREGDPASDA